MRARESRAKCLEAQDTFRNGFYLLIILLAAALAFSPKAKAKTKSSDASTPTESKGGSGQGSVRGSEDSSTSALSLDRYLDQVATQNQAFRGSAEIEQGAKLREDEAELLTTTNFFANARKLWDRTERDAPIFQGTGTDQEAYSLGFSKQTETGLQGRLLYNFNRTDLQGVSRQFILNPEFFTSGPVLELTQSLGRNGFGRETQALIEAQKAQVRAIRLSEAFRRSNIKAQAEVAYWRLGLAREAVESTKDSLMRAERIKQWSASRRRLGLGDRSDELQADAALLARRLELQAAQDEEKAASRAFNTVRGIDSDAVAETLEALTPEIVAQLKLPERAPARADTRSAEQQKIATQASTKAAIERNRPTIEVFGTAGLNGRDPSAMPTINESFSTGHPTATVGVRLSVPLDLDQMSKDREGYRKDAAGAQLVYERRIFEEGREWNDLTSRFNEATARLKLASDIEDVQKNKVEYERDRHRRGRSTTYQVIIFEQDYANAKLSRIRAQADVLNLFAQLKTFGEGQ